MFPDERPTPKMWKNEVDRMKKEVGNEKKKKYGREVQCKPKQRKCYANN
jgi:hypothetical protein